MTEFDNEASMVGFIGDYGSVDDVIALDTKELQEINGSFEEIAQRLEEFLDYVVSSPYKYNVNGAFYDNNVQILSYGLTRGSQQCPFVGCKEHWSDVMKIRNYRTDARLTINTGILHLIRDHHLLEKGNEYGISAREFYEQFMPK